MISNGWRMPSSEEPRGRTESTAKDEQPVEAKEFQSVMVRGKIECLKHQYELAMAQISFHWRHYSTQLNST